MNASYEPESETGREDELDAIVDEILAQIRAGQSSSLSKWQTLYPQWADELAELLPTLLLAETLQPSELTSDVSRSSISGSASMEQASHPGSTHFGLAYPTELGDYELLKELGTGGMGVVFSARQKSLNRTVAVKVLARHLAGNKKLVERFHREAHSAARLHHKNIVPVYDHGTSDGVSWYAMQQIDGESLNESVAKLRAEAEAGSAGGSKPSDTHPLTDYKRLAGIARDVAYALDYAHQHGVIHRDIKPANLILDQTGSIWITDFGLAKVDSESNLTQVGDIVGTLRYVAPEQLDGVTAPSCDIYGLGVTLYELATLRPAWSSDGQRQILEQVRRETVTPPRRIKTDIPRDLETIILKAMARDPRDRYRSARALGDDLDRFCNDLPIKARSLTTFEHVVRWSRKNRLASTALLAVSLLIAIVIPAILINYTLMLRAEIRRVKAAETEAAAANQSNQRQLIESRILQAQAVRSSRSVTAREDALLAVTRGRAALEAFPASREVIDQLQHQLLTEAIAALALPQFRQEPLLSLTDVALQSPAILTATEEHVVVMGFGQGRYQTIVFAHGQPQQPLAKLVQYASFARLIEPQNCLVLLSDLQQPRQVSVLNLATQEPLWRESILSTHWDTEAWTVSPGDRYVLAIDELGKLMRFDVEQRLVSYGATLRNLGQPFKLLCSPSAEQIALVFLDRVEIREFKSGRVLRQIKRPRDAVELSRGYWSPSDRWFAIRFADGTVSIYELPDWKIVRSFSVDASGGALLDASADGRYLLTGSWARRLEAWDVLTGDRITSVSVPLMLHGLNFSNLCIGPVLDSKLVSTFRFQPSSVFESYAQSPNPLVQPFEMTLAPDGSLMIIGHGSAGLSFVDIRGQRFVSSKLPYEFPMFDQRGHLWAIREGTVYRWNHRPAASSDEPVRFEQRTSVLHTYGNHFSVGPTGTTIAWTTEAGGVAVGKLNEARIQPRILKAQGDIRRVVVSPDEKWVVALGWHEPVCLVYEVETDRVWNLAPGFTGTYAQFCPEGSRLVVAIRGDSIRVYRVGEWDKPIRVIDTMVGSPSFSPDGSVLAVGVEPGTVTLFDLVGDREPLKLIQPAEMRASNILFSPDGTQLFFNSADSHCYYRWDLSRLCVELNKLNIGAGLLEPFVGDRLIQTNETSGQDDPLRADSVSVLKEWLEFESDETTLRELEDRLARAYRIRDRRELVETLRQLLQRRPEDPWYNYSLAWYLAASPNSAPEGLPESLELITKALQTEPSNPNFLNMLGVVNYRLGEWETALEALKQSRSHRVNIADTVADEYFLSMAQARLKQRANSLQSFLRGFYLHLRHNPYRRDRWTFAYEAVVSLVRN